MTQTVLTTVRSVTVMNSAMGRLTALQPVIPVLMMPSFVTEPKAVMKAVISA